MADMFIDNMVKKIVVGTLESNTNKSLNENFISSWRFLTRYMVNNFPSWQVYDMIDQIIYEVTIDEKVDQLFIKAQKEGEKILKNPPKNKIKGKARLIIDSKLKITDVADKYGLQVSKNKCICPFHIDSDPSLSFNNSKNVFHCFGCGAKGDIITFIQMMEDIKHGKKRSNV